MRILIVPSWYPTPSNPVNGIFVQQQADALSADHDVRVLYLDVLPRGTRRAPRGWSTRARGYTEQIVEVPNVPLLWQFLYALYLVRAFRSTRAEFRPDVVHAHVAVPAGWGAAILGRLFGVPVVLTEHMSEFVPWLKRPGLRWMAGIAYRRADVVIAVSEGLRQRIRDSFKREKRLVIVPNIVDTARFRPTPLPGTDEGYRLLFVGLMATTQKAVFVLLDAMARVKAQSDIPVHLDLVGDGVLRRDYEEQARRLGLGEIVTFHGLQPNDVIAGLLRQSHALVLPSLHEALPLVIIEAMASGRPVISTRCGGPEYMIDATNGLIVEPDQVEPLASAIIELLTHLSNYDWQRIATDAQNRYSYHAVAAALTSVYMQAVNLKAP